MICLSDCGYCRYWCDPAVIEPVVREKAIDGSVGLEVCTKGLPPDNLRESIQAYIGAPLEWTGAKAADEPVDLEFSGSMDELLNLTGLRRTEPEYA